MPEIDLRDLDKENDMSEKGNTQGFDDIFLSGSFRNVEPKIHIMQALREEIRARFVEAQQGLVMVEQLAEGHREQVRIARDELAKAKAMIEMLELYQQRRFETGPDRGMRTQGE